MKTFVLVATLLVLGLAGSADAYPQYQLSHDATCSSCHLSPAGGNLLNENGLALAESKGQLTAAPEFFYGKVPTPSWLQLGGDLRSAGGFMSTPEKVLAYFPMQLELYAAATFGNFSLHTNFGPRPRQTGNKAATSVWAREHYVMWQQEAGGTEGVYARVGRFMPVFGLRLAEHPLYTRRFGGTQLFADTYGVHVAYVKPKYEAHLTGFIADPLISPVAHDNGGAAYIEARVTDSASVGAEAMISKNTDRLEQRYGITGKVHIPDAKLMLQAEIQFANQVIDKTTTNPVGGGPRQLIGNLVGTFTLADFLLLDVGLGHFDSNISVKNLDRDCFDMNLHYFLDSHLEIVLNTRFEMLSFGKGGPSTGYSLVQLHYRL